MKFSEDQIADLLSAFWMQANFPDNLPSNFEAIAHSFILMIVSSHLKVNIFYMYPFLEKAHDNNTHKCPCFPTCV